MVSPLLNDVKFQKVNDIDVHNDLLKLEDRLQQTAYKFGVVLCLDGQTTEAEMLSNNHEPPEFVEFLDMLGKTVTLKGFKGYSGRID